MARLVRAIAALLGLACAAASAAADLMATIERVKPAVVSVGYFQKTASPQFSLRGTGFAVGNGTTVATNAHVIGDPVDSGRELPARLAVLVRKGGGSGQLRAAELLALDKEHDLALLKIEGEALPSLALRDSDGVREGQSVAFTGFPIGNALGYTPVTHRGMVSAITPIVNPGQHSSQLNTQAIRRLKDGSFNVFQLDATAYPGNSGGPLYDETSGEVIGIINMVLVKGTKESALSTPSGISYAIPANFLRDLLNAPR